MDWHWDDQLYRDLLAITGGKQRLRHYASSIGIPPLEEALIEELHRHKTDYYSSAMKQGDMKLRLGVARLIKEAKANDIKLAFVTTTERDNIEAIASALSASFSLSDFDIVMDRQMVKNEKPSPEVYELALQSLALKASDVVVIEDTSECLQSALDAGIHCCIGMPHKFSLEQDFSSAVTSVTHLGDQDVRAKILQGHDIRSDGQVTVDTLHVVLDKCNLTSPDAVH
jgi:HAD superfamily hydrolase (TIGR01509 family)